MDSRFILFDMMSFLSCYHATKCPTYFSDNGNKFDLDASKIKCKLDLPMMFHKRIGTHPQNVYGLL